MAVAPEALQFALIAGVHPLVGLGSTLVVGLNCALFGGRPGMVSGASATCALVVAPLGKEQPEAIPTAVVLAGLLQLAIGYLKGGRLVRMLPRGPRLRRRRCPNQLARQFSAQTCTPSTRRCQNLRQGLNRDLTAHRLLRAQVNGLAVKVILAQVDHFQFPHGTWLTGSALINHSLLALLSFTVIEGTPSVITEWAPAPLLAMLACLSLSPFMPGVPLLRDVVGEEAFTGGPGALKYAFPSYSLTSFTTALPYACELAAVGLLQSLLTLQLVDGLTRGNQYGRGGRRENAAL